MVSDTFRFHNIKLDKAKKMLIKHRSLQKVTTLIRLIEACLCLIILSRSSSTLIFPIFTLKLTGDYFKGIFLGLVRPGSVFVIGNLIVIILFLKSGHSSSSSSAAQEGFVHANPSKVVDLYDEYVRSCQRNDHVFGAVVESGKKQVNNNGERKTMRRSRSETVMNKMVHHKTKESNNNDNNKMMMKRSVTEKCLRGMEMVRSHHHHHHHHHHHRVDEMSNEEFKSRVEAFIARQQRILREE